MTLLELPRRVIRFDSEPPLKPGKQNRGNWHPRLTPEQRRESKRRKRLRYKLRHPEKIIAAKRRYRARKANSPANP